MTTSNGNSHNKKLEELRSLAISGQYGFKLAGVEIPDVPLEKLGVDGLETYYIEQANRYSLPVKPTLRDYCLLSARKQKIHKDLDPEDLKYASETVLELHKRLNGTTVLSEAAGYARAISTLA